MVLQSRLVWTTTLAALLVLAGCASRPVNPPMTQVDPNGGYTFQTRQKHFKSRDTLVVLAFSGGGTRAAAFSYGALEFLRRTEVAAPDGTKLRLLDAVDMITGVSGGSFTALAYGLYGDKLFADYEQRFLKRNVQGELLSRAASPGHWADYIGGTAGRSELAANYYDEILFNGATFGDLDRGDGPYIVASATDISTGSRIPFSQSVFNLMCTDLNAIRLARAASASSAVPVVLSTVTLNNYGGTCNADVPAWVKMFTQSDNPPRPAARAIRELNEGQALADGVNRPSKFHRRPLDRRAAGPGAAQRHQRPDRGPHPCGAIDFAEAVDYARRVGLPGLLQLDFQQRAARLKALAKYLGERKEELYAISAHTGATRADGWIDIEGGSGTLFAYASVGAGELPSGNLMHEGPALPWARPTCSRHAHPGAARRRGGAHQRLQLPHLGPAGEVRAQLPGRHALHRQAGHRHQLPDRGDGAPVNESGILPAGALQLVIGGTGDLLDRLDGRDVVTFTGSADTAAKLRVHPNWCATASRSTPRPTR
jgi:predicted acylesterase/phospholipase RssA